MNKQPAGTECELCGCQWAASLAPPGSVCGDMPEDDVPCPGICRRIGTQAKCEDPELAQRHIREAKEKIEVVLSDLGWPEDPAFSQAIDRLVTLMEQPEEPVQPAPHGDEEPDDTLYGEEVVSGTPGPTP